MTNQQAELMKMFGITSEVTSRQENKATPNQLQTISNMCVQKKQSVPANLNDFTFNMASAKIDELKQLRVVSESQIKTIKESIVELAEVNVTVAEPDYDTLTGGKDGSASKFITQLFAMKDIYVKKHISEAQWLKCLMPMMACLEIDFESEGINRYETLENGMKRFLTVEEFHVQCDNVFTFKTASEFISKWMPVKNEWTKTRIRPGQANRILQLLERTGGTISNLELMAFSIEQADKYIQDLGEALSAPNVTSMEGASKYEDPRDIVVTQDDIDQQMNNLLHSLIALSNYEGSHTAEEMLSDKKLLSAYIRFLLDDGLVTIQQLVELTDGTDCIKVIFS